MSGAEDMLARLTIGDDSGRVCGDTRCIPCQANIGVACDATERRIRHEERRRIINQIKAGINGGDLLVLARALKDDKVRRNAQLVVHALLTLLEADGDAA